MGPGSSSRESLLSPPHSPILALHILIFTQISWGDLSFRIPWVMALRYLPIMSSHNILGISVFRHNLDAACLMASCGKSTTERHRNQVTPARSAPCRPPQLQALGASDRGHAGSRTRCQVAMEEEAGDAGMDPHAWAPAQAWPGGAVERRAVGPGVSPSSPSPPPSVWRTGPSAARPTLKVLPAKPPGSQAWQGSCSGLCWEG